MDGKQSGFNPIELFQNLSPDYDVFGRRLFIGSRVRAFTNAYYDPGENRIRDWVTVGKKACFYIGVLRQIGITMEGKRCYRIEPDLWIHNGEKRPIIRSVNDIIFPPVNEYAGELPTFKVEAYRTSEERNDLIGRIIAEQFAAAAA